MKETEGGDCKNKSMVSATTPFKFLGVNDKYFQVSNEEKLVTGLTNAWCTIGIDHAIDPQKTSSFEVMAVSLRSDKQLHFSVGLASEDVIKTPGHTHAGHYMEGWDYHCNGHITCDHEYFGNHHGIALNQPFKLEISQYKVNIYIKGIKIATYDEKFKEIFTKHKDTKFYFCVSMAGQNEKIKIIDFKAEK